MSIPPVWALTERGWIHPVKDSEKAYFPVLVRNPSSGYSAAPLGNIPTDSVVVTNDFDEDAINKDLNLCIGSSGKYKFLRVLDRTSEITRVTLEVPTRHDSKLQGWYEVRSGQVIPQKIMRYGPLFAIFIVPLTTACGVAAAAIFSIIIRPKRRAEKAPKI